MVTPNTGVDLRLKFGTVRDQGQRGTCLAFSVTACHECETLAGNGAPLHLSEEYLYWGSKQFASYTNGTSLPAIASALAFYGQPEDHLWPYDENRDENAATYQPPSGTIQPQDCYRATTNQIGLDISLFKTTLSQGRPVVLGIRMSLQFAYAANDGGIALPSAKDVELNNHAVLAVGYYEQGPHADCFIIRNSWGVGWGDAGYGYLPIQYVAQWGVFAGLVSSTGP